MNGRLYGVGVGPGDPELLTLKAARILRRAAVVAYPTGEDGGAMALGIADPHLAAGVLRLPLPLAFDPQASNEAAYDGAAAAITAHLEAGRDVAVLCLGDPFMYGSFLYLFARLAGRVEIEVIPGISSLTACAALAGRPLAARGDSLVVVPATRREDDLMRLLFATEAAAIIKVGRHLAKVRRALDRLGLTEQAVCVERAGLDGQRVVPMNELTEDSVSYFAMILVHRRGRAWS
ncbi:MAG TPA: precorrin-2 C(20)-methyltransferase [Rhodospirillaceae bacterium]|nr:precorrin-2 C(20)-methyltransferase [Rhodospirillaceae bacterium]